MRAPGPRWHQDAQQRVLLEYSNLKQECPDGVYISLRPGDLTHWHGVLFVREGPYSPAILRFNIRFPASYPKLPPRITFCSDIFHPLVTPLTTYTFTTGSTGSDTVSATDTERLPPGGFSLGHGFPQWFGQQSRSGVPSTGSTREPSQSGRTLGRVSHEAPEAGNDMDETPAGTASIESGQGATSGSGSTSTADVSVVDVLHYMKRAFSDETTLDDVALENAGNAGAWKAWQAHRKGRGADMPRLASEADRSQSDEWDWDGVWEQRVSRGIDASISESVLFGSAANQPESIRFAGLSNEAIDEVRAKVLQAVPGE